MSYKIKCYSKKDYKKVKTVLEEQDIPYKQKDKDSVIKVKDVCFSDTLYIPLTDANIEFVLYEYEKAYGYEEVVCSNDKKEGIIFFNDDDYDR